MQPADRVRAHAALGDEHRLAIVDALAVGDRTVAELGAIAGIPGNLLAHHLDVLDEAGLVERRVSAGDRRRRYVTLRWDRLPHLPTAAPVPPGRVAFVCTHNSARSPFAAAAWEQATGGTASSAGTHPAARVHPTAIAVAAEYDIDLKGATPAGYETLGDAPDLVISVCDQAREAGLPDAGASLHWSIADPIGGGPEAFRAAFDEIIRRIGRLTRAAA